MSALQSSDPRLPLGVIHDILNRLPPSERAVTGRAVCKALSPFTAPPQLHPHDLVPEWWLLWWLQSGAGDGILDGHSCGTSAILCTAAAQGHLDALRWLDSHGHITQMCERTLMEEAARGGHMHVLEWLRGRGYPSTAAAVDAAAAAGQVAVLQWLARQQPACLPDEWTCEAAARGGHLHALQWLRAQQPPCPWDAYTCEAAAEHGALEVLRWVRAQQPPCPWSRVRCRVVAARQPHVLQWLEAGGGAAAP